MTDLTKLPKKDVFLALIAQDVVQVRIDSRRAGVVVPSHLAVPDLGLAIGYNASPPIDMEVTDAALHATLSFSGRLFRTTLPWEAIYAITDSSARGMVWPTDVPTEVRVRVEEEELAEALAVAKLHKASEEYAARRGALTVLDGDKQPGVDSDDEAPAQAPRSPFTLIQGGRKD